ncbi:MAG: hypothetical protein HY812_05755 [Planctomycetes bacterium]|nr:hypothetical protein [Planctomycetota bacterium]
MSARRRILDFLFGALAAAGLMGWLLQDEGTPVRADETSGAGEFLMATGAPLQGGALLFVLNTRTRVLNVYEAEGGTRTTRGLTFVASRKIERDLYVTGYNDKSEYSYQDLLKRFEMEEARSKALETPGVGPEDGR